MRNLLMTCCLTLGLIAPAALANKTTLDPLGSMDQVFIDRQLQRIDDLARTKLGLQIRGNLSDLQLLQRLIDQRLVEQSDTETQQAMGAVMAQVFLKDLPILEWKVYTDKIGRSRALCVRETKECLFPMTMLSRRIEKGLSPDVRMVYEDAILLLEDYLPKYPYGGGIMRRLHDSSL